MLNRLAADLRHREVRLLPAGEIGQVRDMLAAVSDDGQAPEYHRTVSEAVHVAQAGQAGQPAEER
jgi:hypothetical protein